jgi:hypothetical protein
MDHKEWREAGKPNEGELIKTKKSCKRKFAVFCHFKSSIISIFVGI